MKLPPVESFRFRHSWVGLVVTDKVDSTMPILFLFLFYLFFFLVWTVAAEVSSVLVKLMIVTHATTPEGCVLSVTPATVHAV